MEAAGDGGRWPRVTGRKMEKMGAGVGYHHPLPHSFLCLVHDTFDTECVIGTTCLPRYTCSQNSTLPAAWKPLMYWRHSSVGVMSLSAKVRAQCYVCRWLWVCKMKNKVNIFLQIWKEELNSYCLEIKLISILHCLRHQK